jgi:hypothetical protein
LYVFSKARMALLSIVNIGFLGFLRPAKVVASLQARRLRARCIEIFMALRC